MRKHFLSFIAYTSTLLAMAMPPCLAAAKTTAKPAPESASKKRDGKPSGLPTVATSQPASPTTKQAARPIEFKALLLEPSSLEFQNGSDHRKILVRGETRTGQMVDLTAEAKLLPSDNVVKVADDGYIVPAGSGKTMLLVEAGGLKAKLPVTVKDATIPPIGFIRDVEPVLSKLGCNAGTCHGSAKGKNGFKLSLRGYDPDYDYQALVNDLSGRRFNRIRAEDSLMLLKPTAEVPHEGRQALKPDSRYYKLLRDWIVQGAATESGTGSRAVSIEVLPKTVELEHPEEHQQLLVIAHYADGSTREVTREAMFTSNDSDVALVKENEVRAIRRGEAAVLVRYEGCYETREVTVMGDRTGFSWAAQSENNFIDTHVNAKLKRMKILPSELCNDAEFIRRVYLDLTGAPPPAEKIRAFLADKTASNKKRDALVDELVGDRDFVAYWANKWADLLQCNSENLGQTGVWHFKNWITEQFARNTPYDQMVRALLSSRGSSYLNPEVNYLRVLREPGKIAEDVSQTFLGVRFNCNKCHDHPFEKWTQNQYYEFAAYFARVGFKRGTFGTEEVRNFTGDRVSVTGEEIVFLKYDGGEVKHLKTDKDVPPKVPYGTAKAVPTEGDRRAAFVDWLVSPENPLFAKSLVNRVWSYFHGRGIIDPVDDIRGSNPPSNPALLDALTEDFIKSGFDIRHLMKTICKSRTYQLSIVPTKWNEDDKSNFSHMQPRRLSAEQLLGAVEVATGQRPMLKDLPPGFRVTQAPDGIIPGNDFLALFGRPKRQSACECERGSNVTLSHALNLINGSTIGDAVNSSTNTIAKIVEATPDNKRMVEDIYLSVLSRPPTQQEISQVTVAEGTSRLETAQDLAWALMNSPAFLFNR